MTALIAATLNAEDLGRWRISCARRSAIESALPGWTADRAEQFYMERISLEAEFEQRYNLDPARAWACQPTSGVIVYDD